MYGLKRAVPGARRRVVLLAGVGLALLAGRSFAQSTEAAAVGELVVTAQKRTERLQDVPLAVTALTASQLDARQITDTVALTKTVPSLTFQQGNNPTNTTFRLRGMGTTLFGQGVEPSVSLVVDGVVAARQAQGFADFADLERVEVLPGPQGTLFGKNSTAGVISIVTARPSRTVEGSGEVTVAQGDEHRVKGTISGPLSDTVSARLTGYYNDVGGYEWNAATDEPYASSRGYGLRGKLEWDPTSRLNLLASIDYRQARADCCRPALVATSNPLLRELVAPVVASPTNHTIDDDAPSWYFTNQYTFSLQADYDLGPAKVTSISAYQIFRADNHVDADGYNTPVPVYPGVSVATVPSAYGQFDVNEGQLRLGNLSQELRIASNGAGRLSYVAGIYLSDLHLNRTFQRRAAYCLAGVTLQPCAPAATTWLSAYSAAKLTEDDIAAFGQVEYRVVGGLKLIGGLRLQRMWQSVSGYSAYPLAPGDLSFGVTPSSGEQSVSNSAVSGKAGLQYEFSRDAQAYATYTRGYKGPAFDTEITANFARQAPLKPEYVNAYEVGYKAQFFGRRLAVAADLFLADYTDLQIQANVSNPANGTITFIQTNAGSAQTKGAELQVTANPMEGLTFNAGATYDETRVSIASMDCPLQSQAAAPVITGAAPANLCYRTSASATPQQRIVDGVLPAAPRWRLVFSPRYEQGLFGDRFRAFGQIDVNYQSSEEFAIEQDPLLKQGGFTLVDLSVGVRDPASRYAVTLFVKNLFDRNYYTTMAHGSLLANAAAPNDLYATYAKDARRYVGATLSGSF